VQIRGGNRLPRTLNARPGQPRRRKSPPRKRGTR
jgi:hypothetical protein